MKKIFWLVGATALIAMIMVIFIIYTFKPFNLLNSLNSLNSKKSPSPPSSSPKNPSPSPSSPSSSLVSPSSPLSSLVAPSPSTPSVPSISSLPRTIPKEFLRGLPPSFLIDNVPFTVQAPGANWDAVHEEFCEEAAVLVVAAYFRRDKRENIPAEEAEKELQEIAQWERDKFGFFEDTNVELTSRILEEKYKLKTEVKNDSTTDDIKKTLHDGKLIIAPTAGRLLKNPYFKQPGPVYHMVVIIGWDNDNFIVQDVGTKRGRHYHYAGKTLLNALHDLYSSALPPLDEDKMAAGEKKIIIVSLP